MNQASIDLSGLKGIIIPAKPDFLPLAPGWWLMMTLFLFLITCLLIIWAKYYFSPLAYALRELKKAKKNAATPVQFARDSSKLLKRVALYKFGSDKAATLSESAWARFLMRQGKHIDPQVAEYISVSTYLPDHADTPLSITKINHTVQKIIKHMLKGKTK